MMAPKRMKWINREMRWTNKCLYCGISLHEGTKAWMRKEDGPGGKWEFCCDDCYENGHGDPGEDLTLDEDTAPSGLPTVDDEFMEAVITHDACSGEAISQEVRPVNNENRQMMDEWLDERTADASDQPPPETPKVEHKPYSLPWIKEHAKWSLA